MKSFQSQTHYEVLEISVGATLAEIRAAHERLTLLYADDQVALYGLIDPARGAALRVRLEEALEVLTDDARREAYDLKIGLPPRVVVKPPAPKPVVSGQGSAASGWGGGAISWVTPGGGTAPVAGSYTYAVTPTKAVAAPPPMMVVPVPARILAVALPPIFAPALPAPAPPAPAPAPAPPAPPAPAPPAPAPPAPAPPAPAPPAPAPPAPAPPAPAPALAAPAVPPAPALAPPAAPPPAPEEPRQLALDVRAGVAQWGAKPAPEVVEPPPEPPAPPLVAAPEPAAPERAPEAPAAEPQAEVPPIPASSPPGASIPLPQSSPPTPVLADDAEVAIVPARASPNREFRVEQKPRPYEIPEGVEINGDLLKQVRLAKGLSLVQVADRTRIGVKHLENVEGDRYDALPAAVYLRGILMNLARELGLDGLRVSRSYLTFVEAHRSKG